MLVVDEIYGHAVENELLYADVFLTPAKLCIEIEHVFDLIGVFVLDAAVIRYYDARIYA